MAKPFSCRPVIVSVRRVSLRAKAQNKIEQEIIAFENNMWGDQVRKDSLDSIAKMDKKELKKARKANRRAGGATVKRTRRSKDTSGSSNSSARVTVRRQRH